MSSFSERSALRVFLEFSRELPLCSTRASLFEKAAVQAINSVPGARWFVVLK